MNHIKFWTAAFIHRTNMIHALLYFIAQDKKSQAEHLSNICLLYTSPSPRDCS